jgi:curved DNA-binding protein CbpA
MSSPSTVAYKEKDSTPNFYTILKLKPDVCEKENCDELIEKAYQDMVKKYHPDKHRSAPPERLEQIEALFEMITTAYDILKVKKTRDDYNYRQKLKNQSSADFGNLKKKTEEYYDSQEYLPANDQQKLDFKKKMEELNTKHEYNASLEGMITKKDANKRMEQLMRDRELQDVQLKPERLFTGAKMNDIDLKKFHEAFDLSYNKDDDHAIVEHNGAPSAWNLQGAQGSNGFSTVDDLGTLYVDGGNLTQGNVTNMKTQVHKQKKLTRKDVASLKGADYVDNHNVINEDYYDDIKKKLRDRQQLGKNIEKMNFNDFKRDDTAGYGIFEQLGINAENTLELDGTEEESIADRYNELMKKQNKVKSNDSTLSNDDKPNDKPNDKSNEKSKKKSTKR